MLGLSIVVVHVTRIIAQIILSTWVYRLNVLSIKVYNINNNNPNPYLCGHMCGVVNDHLLFSGVEPYHMLWYRIIGQNYAKF